MILNNISMTFDPQIRKALHLITFNDGCLQKQCQGDPECNNHKKSYIFASSLKMPNSFQMQVYHITQWSSCLDWSKFSRGERKKMSEK